MVSLEELRKEELGKDHKLLEVKLIYDQPQFRLETFYFWLVDFLRDGLKLKVEKINDVFGASAGSFFLGNLGQRLGVFLGQGKELGATINNIARTIISLLNEYKLIESRLKLYDDIKSNEKNTALAAFKSLKSIWMDNVDSQKGGAALLSLRAKLGFATIVDIFMLYEIKDKIEDLFKKGIISKELRDELVKRDLEQLEEKKIINQRVINIVKARLEEFYNWLELSEKEIRGRRNILKAYLLHEINAFVFYTEFAKPYFRLARKLLMKDYSIPDIATVFETAIIELSLLAYGDEKEIEDWDDEKNEKIKKTYIPVHEISIRFRALPTVASQMGGNVMYSYIGRTDFDFRSYLLKKEEFDELKISEEVEDLLYIQGMTDDFLKAVAEAIYSIFLWDHIQSDNNLKKKVAEFLNKKPEELRRPEDVEWTRDLIDLIKKEKPQLLKGIEWIKKYLPKKEEKKGEKKNEEKKEEKSERTIIQILPFTEVLVNLLEKLFRFIVTFPINLQKIEKDLEKKKIKDKAKEELENLKNDTIDTGWKIYSTFKKMFGLLSW